MKRLFIGFILLLALLQQSFAQLKTIGFDLPKGAIPVVQAGNNKFRITQGAKTLGEGNLLDLLYETRATIEYYRLEESGELKPFFGSITASNTHLVAVHSFCKYLPVEIDGKNYAYGIKTFIRADFAVKARGANISSLFGIGLSASTNKISGVIQVAVTGISGPQVNAYISMPGKLDETTITKALEDFAVIKSKLYDEDTVITPTIIAEIVS